MTIKILLAAGALAISAASFAATAQANPYHHGHHYGYGAVVEEDDEPRVVVVPERTGVYFKRNFVGTRDVVQQCYKRRSWTSTGELFWSEVCQ